MSTKNSHRVAILRSQRSSRMIVTYFLASRPCLLLFTTMLFLFSTGCGSHPIGKDKLPTNTLMKMDYEESLNLDQPENIYQVQVGDQTISYRTFGKKSRVPILLLQRYRGSMVDWDPLFLKELSKHNQLIIFDNIGIGSSSGNVPDSIDEMAAIAIAFVKSLKYSKVHLLGWSMGGFIVQKMIDEESQLFGSVILMATTYEGSLLYESPPDMAILSIAGGIRWGFEENRFLLFTDSEQGNQAAIASWRRIDSITRRLNVKPVTVSAYKAQGLAIEKFLKTIKTKALKNSAISKFLVMDGDKDGSYDLGHQLNLVKKYSAHLAIYPNAGHGFYQQYPKRVAKDISDFIDRGPL